MTSGKGVVSWGRGFSEGVALECDDSGLSYAPPLTITWVMMGKLYDLSLFGFLM